MQPSLSHRLERQGHRRSYKANGRAISAPQLVLQLRTAANFSCVATGTASRKSSGLPSEKRRHAGKVFLLAAWPRALTGRQVLHRPALAVSPLAPPHHASHRIAKKGSASGPSSVKSALSFLTAHAALLTPPRFLHCISREASFSHSTILLSSLSLFLSSLPFPSNLSSHLYPSQSRISCLFSPSIGLVFASTTYPRRATPHLFTPPILPAGLRSIPT